MAAITNFQQLDVWKKGIELVKEVYRVSASFPPYELYGLVSQMRRAAVSVPANISEGFRRSHSKEFKQFLNMARSSCAELETHIVIANELRYVKGEVKAALLERTDHISRMLSNLMKRL